ncbi:MAG: DUF1015 domain-containing protein, partial [Oscillospiraceae bacterium]|nr:DUF1015 domain-containing protein [Oscillospiraceae bacterium]
MATRELAQMGIAVPQALLPAQGVDAARWAVVACDQYTAEPAYWQAVARLVGDAPSTYHITLPEVYINEGTDRVPAIHETMARYRAQGVLTPTPRGFVLVARQVRGGERLGLMLAVDLEQYDFAPGAKSLIRPTEGTVAARIPPRMAIRRGASLECPHVMLLADDPGDTLIAPLYAERAALPPLYDVDLMAGGGRVRGWAVADDARIGRVQAALSGLYDACGGLLLAVGDGNHSLATARQCWLDLREGLSAEQRRHHPARFALAEVVNLHDPALRFEGIHRALFGVEPDDALDAWARWARALGLGPASRAARPGEQGMTCLARGMRIPLALSTPRQPLLLAPLQAFFDAYLAAH